jgi:methylated-DNA-[protein]-cysteine S-methyltransferase
MTNAIEMECSLGRLALEAEAGLLSAVRFDSTGLQTIRSTPELDAASRQLSEYFAGSRRLFSLPLALPEAPFDRAVLAELGRIPYGERTTYGAVTTNLGLERGLVRKVAAAIGRNPLPILIPCHRVIGSDGSLTGYGGGLQRKARLLALEADQLQLVPV